MPRIHRRISSAAANRRGCLRLLADTERGFTIIEVVVSALIVAMLAGAAATALIATGNISADQRRRAQADEIAQQDQERLRGMSTNQLAGLTQTRSVGPYEGTTYTVTSTARFLSNTGASTCTSSGTGAAAYLKVHSEVTWAGNNRSPVVQESVITPPAGGTLLTNVKDQNSDPLSGANVAASGPDSTSAVTDTDGCTVFGALTTGDYTVTVTKGSGDFPYVDPDGNPTPTHPATVSGTGTSYPTPNPFQLGQASLISANFKTTIASTTYTGQLAPALSWFNVGMSASQRTVLGTPSAGINTTGPPWTLFPFISGSPNTYTNNYQVWAGKCDIDKPPSANASYATVPPASWVILNDGGSPLRPRVQMPALKVLVNAGPSGSQPRVKPAHVKITDGCTQSWFPSVRTDGGTNTTFGSLDFPGQPYAPNVTGQKLTVCADFGGYRASATTPNTNFADATTVTVTILTGTGGDANLC